METAIFDDYLDSLKNILDSENMKSIAAILDILDTALEENKKVFVFGNGGSASTAEHVVCDLNSLDIRGRKFKAICLTSNNSLMTARANDNGYDTIFLDQLSNMFEEGDVAFGISASGNSPNVVKAVEFAKENGGKVISFTGFDGGKLKQLSDASLHANIENYEISEDVHLVAHHIIKTILMKRTKT